MDILISGKGIEVTESMKQYVDERMMRLMRFWNVLIRCRIEIALNKHRKQGRIFAMYAWIESPGKDIRATVDATEFYEAVDLLYEKLERLVRRAKEKATDG